MFFVPGVNNAEGGKAWQQGLPSITSTLPAPPSPGIPLHWVGCSLVPSGGHREWLPQGMRALRLYPLGGDPGLTSLGHLTRSKGSPARALSVPFGSPFSLLSEVAQFHRMPSHQARSPSSGHTRQALGS